mmetsp:Transcript_23697/g.76104  ORF Transcript_23697/g.76104 Transcript_23697/m.76104 type:complete len:233 (-) Transcript_23697:1633-2331(-)
MDPRRPDRRPLRRHAPGLFVGVVHKGDDLGDRQREHRVRQVQFLVLHLDHNKIARHVHEERALHEILHDLPGLGDVAVVRTVAVLEDVPHTRRRPRGPRQVAGPDHPDDLRAAVLALVERFFSSRAASTAASPVVVVAAESLPPERRLDRVGRPVRVEDFHDDAPAQGAPPLLLRVARVVRHQGHPRDAHRRPLDRVVAGLPREPRARRRRRRIPRREPVVVEAVVLGHLQT